MSNGSRITDYRLRMMDWITHKARPQIQTRNESRDTVAGDPGLWCHGAHHPLLSYVLMPSEQGSYRRWVCVGGWEWACGGWCWVGSVKSEY